MEPVGTVIEPDAIGRLRGNDAARRTEIASYDADARAVLTWLSEQTEVDEQRLGAIGFCIGGHLAFRAALRPGMRATACLYPTGLQNGKLGRGIADSLQRAGEIKGALFTLFGSEDPHVPAEDRDRVLEALRGQMHEIVLLKANHTSMRDDGWRWDQDIADQACAALTPFLRRELPPAHPLIGP